MSIGRKKTKVSEPKIAAPPAITQGEYTLPTGDRYLSRQQGHREITEALLSPLTRQTVDRGQQAMVQLADELARPDARRMADIQERSQTFFERQARGIHEEADDQVMRAASDLGKRFGGTYNATFGTDLLARLEQNRLEQLAAARLDASLYGEDLARADEESRIQRFQLFQNYLGDLNNQAQNYAALGSNLLQDERNRAQDLAVMRAQLAQNAQRYNQEAELTRRQQRADLLRTAMANLLSPKLLGI